MRQVMGGGRFIIIIMRDRGKWCVNSVWTLVLVLLWCQSQVVVSALSTLSPRVVHTKQSIFQGFLGPGNARIPKPYSSTYNFHGFGGRPIVEIFKGIPYANPPVGALRYDSPAPLPPFSSRNDIYFANVTKPACPRTYEEALNRTRPEDGIRSLRKALDLEDCLYLDLYVPFHHKENAEGYPVLVYANSVADDPKDPWDGSSVAAIGNIMVINFRYRVGVLGFVQPGFTDDTRNNFGLWDMIAALQWIKENVEKFGGNPNEITLMGYDLDANLAGILALSPISADAYEGLFHRLILLNGSPLSPTSINHQPHDTTFHLSSALHCPLHDRVGELVSCLRSKPTPALLAAAEKIGTPLLSYRFAPNVDGIIVKEDFLQNGQIKVNMDLLGRYDLLTGLREGPTLPNVGRPPWQSFNLDQFVTAVIKLTLRMEPSSEPTPEVKQKLKMAIFQEYGASPSMKELISDFLLVHPTIEMLNAHSRTGKNTFFYVFKDFDPQRKGKSEIPYIFSAEVYRWKYAGSPQTITELQTFEALITLLANFVRTGDPNVSDRSDRYTNAASSWPKYSEDMGQYLEIGRDVRVPANYRKSQMIFWSRVFPTVIHSFARSYLNGTDGTTEEFFPFGKPPMIPDNMNVYSGGIGGGGGGRGDIPNMINPLHPNRNMIYPAAPTTSSSLSQNTVVLIGCLLLLLNTMCFLGLFYQRERLKKAELMLRRRYMESAQPSSEHDIHDDLHEDDDSAYRRAPPTHHHHHHHHPITERPRCPVPSRDAMSETETENGFGPDFLGPNYDPRTKVNRWMNLQQRERLNMTPPSEMMTPFPRDITPPPPPIQIQVSSIQRNSKPPPEVLPHFPYQEPYQPPHNYDIPYADSRATSPSIVTSPAYNNNLTTNNFNNANRRAIPPYGGSSELASNSSPKRGSVLIVRDLDPVDDELESSGPKFVPVKTGTLKRSMAVGTDGNNSKEGSTDVTESTDTVNSDGTQAASSSKKISFADGL